MLTTRLSSQRCHDLRGFLFSPLVPELIRFVQGNLIYLALITERVPIVGPFTPSHVFGAGEILFSEVFDIDYLSERIRIPVLEWSEVKNYSSPEIEDIGCWSVWQAVKTSESRPRGTNAMSLQGLGKQTHIFHQAVETLIYHRGQTFLLLLALRRSKSSKGTNMIHMRISGKSPRFSIHPAERKAW